MKSITPGQMEQFARFVTDASGPSTKTALEQLRDDWEFSHEGLQRALGKGNQLKSRLIPLLKAMIKEMATNIQGCVKRILDGEEIAIAKTSGKENLAHAKDVFTGWVDPDFVNYGCDVEGEPTAPTPVEVFEMVENGDFARIFGGFNVSLDQLRLSQHQIKAFARDHRDKLRTEGYGTFFLFKVGEEFFVAYVHFYGGGRLRVYVHRFSDVNVWGAERRHRVVLPKLNQ
ncbi:MAG: hypothetical protein WC648_02105 [Candidatus Paceibacterota bacterium]|jgi:hypothetical protein